MAQLGRFLMAAWVAAPLGSFFGSLLLIAIDLARFSSRRTGRSSIRLPSSSSLRCTSFLAR